MHKFPSFCRTECHSVQDGLANRPTWKLMTGNLIGQLRQTGHERLLCYMLQQVAQFRNLGEEFAMQHAGTEYLDELEDELQTVLDAIPVENRLRGLPAEEVLRRFTAEELAGGLSKEQTSQLRELLERMPGD